MDSDSNTVLNYFFTNSDKPIFSFRNMPPSIQNYIYLGISRFPSVRERFLKLLTDKNLLGKVADFIKKNQSIDMTMTDIIKFTAERNCDIFFNRGHGSSSEGSSVFVVSEQNPIYATEDQQDFYYPMTTMEFSTRYATRFDLDHVYWDSTLMSSEFADEIKSTIAKNFEIYKKGIDAVMQVVSKKQDPTNKISALDAIRFIIPISAYTTIILGGNVRSVYEHFHKLMANEDNFMKYFVGESLKELSKIVPGYFENLKPDGHVIERNKKLREYANEIFKEKFKPVKEDVQLFYELPVEELALTQIIYPFCCLPFEYVYDKISSLNENERKELFELTNIGRENKRNPIRGFETRHLVFEIETGWALWKDFKRNRMNLRFHQDTRGLAGFDTPELVKESDISKEYEKAQKKTSELIEKVYEKFGNMSRIVASQGSRKRYLLCMGPRQLTVLTELRTSGEGDRGYRRIASKMIELAKEKNPRLFGHIKDNFRIM